eukprot:151423-Prorocentrum_minimum.AAC.3
MFCAVDAVEEGGGSCVKSVCRPGVGRLALPTPVPSNTVGAFRPGFLQAARALIQNLNITVIVAAGNFERVLVPVEGARPSIAKST